MLAKRRLNFDDIDDELVIDDRSEKRRKMNDEEQEARDSFQQWAMKNGYGGTLKEKRDKKERTRIESDSDIEVVDATDAAPSTSRSAPSTSRPLPSVTAGENDNLNVFPVKLEEINVDDIVLQVNLLSIAIK